MDKLSIIIPIYNSELYLKRCLDSIIAQTYTNLEIICINDGSTDSGGKICDEYAQKDSRIKVYHKPNGGESSARNAGLRLVTGKYIGFIDNDDWIEPNMYESLYASAESNNVPMSVSGFYRDTDTVSTEMKNNSQIPDGVMSAKDMMLCALNRDSFEGYGGYVWNRLFSSKLILNNGITFDENLKFGGDILFCAQAVLADGCKGAYIKKPLYHHYLLESSTSHSKNIFIKKDILIAYKRIEEILDKKGYSDISYWARAFYCHHASVVAELALIQQNKDMFSFMQNEIRAHIDDYIKTNEAFPQKLKRIYRLADNGIG